MKNIALVIPDFENPDINNMIYSLYPKINEKYDVSILSFGNEIYDNAEFEGEIASAFIPLDKTNIIKEIFSQIKRIFTLRKFVKENDIRLLLSFTEETNFPLAYSFLPVKKAIICNSLPSLKKNAKKYHAMLKSSDAILFNSEILRQFFEEKYPADANKIHVIVPPLDTESAITKSAEPLEDEYKAFFESHKVISSYGPFSPEKCHCDILKSFEIVKKTIKNAALVFVGSGGEISDEIHNMADSSQYKDDILFIDNPSNPYKYIAASSAYVQASCEEVSAGHLIEAMAFKTPVISTDCGAFSAEILFDNYDPEFKCDNMTFADRGIIVPPFDGRANFDHAITYGAHLDMANAMKEMLLSERITSLLVDKAYDSLKNFSTDKAFKKYVEFIDKLYLCL